MLVQAGSKRLAAAEGRLADPLPAGIYSGGISPSLAEVAPRCRYAAPDGCAGRAKVEWHPGELCPRVGFMVQAYARARELWEQLGSPSEFFHIPLGQSRYHMARGRLDLAQRVDEDLLSRGARRGDPAGLVLGHYSSARTLGLVGKFAICRSHLEEVTARYDPVSHRSLFHQTGLHLHVSSQAYLGIILLCLGFPEQAVVRSRAAIDEARRLTHPPSLAASLAIGVRLLLLVGDNAILGEWVDQLVRVTSEQGFPFWRAQGTIYAGGSGSRKSGRDSGRDRPRCHGR